MRAFQLEMHERPLPTMDFSGFDILTRVNGIGSSAKFRSQLPILTQ